MGKSRSALKWKKEEKAPEPEYTITGGVIRGYTVWNRNQESVFFSHQMWDAITEKERLLNGGTPQNL